ncbi:conserved hypothetical protein [Neospora caninum Liverpool]|uniref:Uncharacterized protein n=1 Tax=Neospora caninum (strain Liverpool) TaxID=572307 RepID=F0VIK8_NEOCL|nr:conserved hypothetical protein [Neospora caninum Liverpool]CBZ53569.1 conserved hypothetical protein [Neospora caninum Liverpool]CEL67557.1 TPA: hypothetical protein BN1204_033560 [Neospora caninum Liverpool]|eukprot:XP_003883601.1 conserved hypothetical protein [Neospora caninum Liverpool]
MQDAAPPQGPQVQEGPGACFFDGAKYSTSHSLSTFAPFPSAQFLQAESQCAPLNAHFPSSSGVSSLPPSTSSTPVPHAMLRDKPDTSQFFSSAMPSSPWGGMSPSGELPYYFSLPSAKHSATTAGFASPFPSPAHVSSCASSPAFAASSPASPSPASTVASSAGDGHPPSPLWQRPLQTRDARAARGSFPGDGRRQGPQGLSGAQKHEGMTHAFAPHAYPGPPRPHGFLGYLPSSPHPSLPSSLPQSTPSQATAPSGFPSFPPSALPPCSPNPAYASYSQAQSSLRPRQDKLRRTSGGWLPPSAIAAAAAAAATADGALGDSAPEAHAVEEKTSASWSPPSVSSPPSHPPSADPPSCGNATSAQTDGGAYAREVLSVQESPSDPSQVSARLQATPAASEPCEGRAAGSETPGAKDCLPGDAGADASGLPLPAAAEGTPATVPREGTDHWNGDAQPSAGFPASCAVETPGGAGASACSETASAPGEGTSRDVNGAPGSRPPLKASPPPLSRASPAAKRPSPSGGSAAKRASFSLPSSSSGSSQALSRSPSSSSVLGGEDGAAVLLDQHERVLAVLRRRREASAACLRLLRDEMEHETRTLRQLETRVRWRMQHLVSVCGLSCANADDAANQRPGTDSGEENVSLRFSSARPQGTASEKGETSQIVSLSSPRQNPPPEDGEGTRDGSGVSPSAAWLSGEEPEGDAAVAKERERKEATRDRESATGGRDSGRGVASGEGVEETAKHAGRGGPDAKARPEAEESEETEIREQREDEEEGGFTLSFHAFLERRIRRSSALRAAGEGRWHMVPVANREKKRSGTETGETQPKPGQGSSALAGAETVTAGSDSRPGTAGGGRCAESPEGCQSQGSETHADRAASERGEEDLGREIKPNETPEAGAGQASLVAVPTEQDGRDKSGSSGSARGGDDPKPRVQSARTSASLPLGPSSTLQNLDEVQLQLLWLKGKRPKTAETGEARPNDSGQTPETSVSVPEENGANPASYLDRLGVAVATVTWQDSPWNFAIPSSPFSSSSFSSASPFQAPKADHTGAVQPASPQPSSAASPSASASPSALSHASTSSSTAALSPASLENDGKGRLFRWETYAESGGESEGEETEKALALLKNRETDRARSIAIHETRQRQYKQALAEYHSQFYKLRFQQLAEIKAVEGSRVAPAWRPGHGAPLSAPVSASFAGFRSPCAFTTPPPGDAFSFRPFSPSAPAQVSPCEGPRPTGGAREISGEETHLHARWQGPAMHPFYRASMPASSPLPFPPPSVCSPPWPGNVPGFLSPPVSHGEARPIFSPLHPSFSPIVRTPEGACMRPGPGAGALEPKLDVTPSALPITEGKKRARDGSGLDGEQGSSEGPAGPQGQEASEKKARLAVRHSAPRQRQQPRPRQKLPKSEPKRRGGKEENSPGVLPQVPPGDLHTSVAPPSLQAFPGSFPNACAYAAFTPSASVSPAPEALGWSPASHAVAPASVARPPFPARAPPAASVSPGRPRLGSEASSEDGRAPSSKVRCARRKTDFSSSSPIVAGTGTEPAGDCSVDAGPHPGTFAFAASEAGARDGLPVSPFPGRDGKGGEGGGSAEKGKRIERR